MRRADELVLGSKLGAGGEADVYELRGEPKLAVKLYRAPRAARAAKLRLMIEHPPPAASGARLAWPRELVVDSDGAVRGFVMDRFDPKCFRPIHQLYNPKTRRQVAPGFNTRYLMHTAGNLATAIAAVHATGAVVGDLNESNVLVDAQATVALVDCDSFQVTDADGVVHPCPVAKPEFTAPELHGRDLQTRERRASADLFALAVLVLLLLREGRHPFAGAWRGAGQPPDLAAHARRRRLPARWRRLAPAPFALPWRSLPWRVRLLGRVALTAPPALDRLRPQATAWTRALGRAEHRLLPCRRSAQHLSVGRVRAWRCPWCALVDAGIPDPFPGAAGKGITAQPRVLATVRRRVVMTARALSAPILEALQRVGRAAVDRTTPLLRREAAVAGALVVASSIAPIATLFAVGAIAVPLAALVSRSALREVMARSGRAAALAAAVAIATVGLAWWIPTDSGRFARWSPSQAGDRAMHLALLAMPPFMGLVAMRRIGRGAPRGNSV
ncbi:MAG: hypothetical protein QOK28_1794 [Actinomycetota bacterium]